MSSPPSQLSLPHGTPILRCGYHGDGSLTLWLVNEGENKETVGVGWCLSHILPWVPHIEACAWVPAAMAWGPKRIWKRMAVGPNVSTRTCFCVQAIFLSFPERSQVSPRTDLPLAELTGVLLVFIRSELWDQQSLGWSPVGGWNYAMPGGLQYIRERELLLPALSRSFSPSQSFALSLLLSENNEPFCCVWCFSCNAQCNLSLPQFELRLSSLYACLWRTLSFWRTLHTESMSYNSRYYAQGPCFQWAFPLKCCTGLCIVCYAWEACHFEKGSLKIHKEY